MINGAEINAHEINGEAGGDSAVGGADFIARGTHAALPFYAVGGATAIEFGAAKLQIGTDQASVAGGAYLIRSGLHLAFSTSTGASNTVGAGGATAIEFGAATLIPSLMNGAAGGAHAIEFGALAASRAGFSQPATAFEAGALGAPIRWAPAGGASVIEFGTLGLSGASGVLAGRDMLRTGANKATPSGGSSVLTVGGQYAIEFGTIGDAMPRCVTRQHFAFQAGTLTADRGVTC